MKVIRAPHTTGQKAIQMDTWLFLPGHARHFAEIREYTSGYLYKGQHYALGRLEYAVEQALSDVTDGHRLRWCPTCGDLVAVWDGGCVVCGANTERLEA